MRFHGLPLLVVLLLPTLGLAPRPAPAAEDDLARIFTVFGVEVDVRAATAMAARREAMAEARAEAFRRLVDKLVAEDDADLVTLPEPGMLEQLVRAVDIAGERSSATRYIATIDIAFSVEAVRELFTQAGVAYTESAGGPYLLLPLFLEGGVRHLFGAHDWRAALGAADRGNRLVGYRLPQATLVERSRLSPTLVARAGAEDLRALAEAFEVSRIVIADAEMRLDPATGRPAVAWRVVAGPDREMEDRGLEVAAGEEDRAALLARTADRVLGAIDRTWKARTLVAGQEIGRLEVLAPVRDLAGWTAVRERLATVSLIRRTEITRIALPVSAFEIAHIGSLEQFRLALAQARLDLAFEGGPEDGVWVLRPSEQVPEPAGQAESGKGS